MVRVTLQYFDDCPNWRTGRERLQSALEQVGPDRFDIELRLIISHEQAVAEGFHGSPSFLLDGVDPFTEPGAPVGMACRVYRTADGLAGAPTVGQLVEVLAEAAEQQSAAR